MSCSSTCAGPPTSASRQQQRIRMIRQCCAMFTQHLPAVENTWRHRWDGESFQAYRERVVSKGDGDLFRGLQLMEQALQQRTELQLRMIGAVHPHAAEHVAALRQHAAALLLERGPAVPPRTFAVGTLQLSVGSCAHCRALWVSEDAQATTCELCRAVHACTEQWAPQMPTKPARTPKKKKKKRKRKRLPNSVPTPLDLQQLMKTHPTLQQQVLGQLPLGAAAASSALTWSNPFEDPHLPDWGDSME